MNSHTSYILKILFAVIILTQLNACSNCKKSEVNSEQQKLTIFAAASLSDVISELADTFEIRYNVKININLASSGTLARQIEQGENPDLFISASKTWVDYIDSLGEVVRPFIKPIIENTLVLIVPKDGPVDHVKIDSSFNLLPILGRGRLSIGDPNHVPAGKYARQSLDYYGWYQNIEKQVLPAKDVRSALMVVEMGEVPAGIVYQTDALKSQKVKIVGIFSSESHDPIIYVSAVCNDNAMSKELFNYISSKEMIPIWSKYGFNE